MRKNGAVFVILVFNDLYYGKLFVYSSQNFTKTIIDKPNKVCDRELKVTIM